MTKSVAVTPVRPLGHSAGLSIAATFDKESDFAAGFRAGRNPELRDLRRAHNDVVVARLIQEEMAKLQS